MYQVSDIFVKQGGRVERLTLSTYYSAPYECSATKHVDLCR